MSATFRIVVLLLCGCAVAAAQKSYAYWVAAPGGLTAGSHTSFRAFLAGGGEVAIGKGFSAGPELGFVTPKQDFASSVQGLASLNGYYHPVRSRDSRWDPFATAGYSILFRSDTRNLFNYGAGLNYWVAPSMALRVEVRDHTFSDPVRAHLWEFRIGVPFSELWP